MVTTLKTKEGVEAPPITLEELGEMVGIPIKVRPWWGSVRRRSVHQLMRVAIGDSGEVTDSQTVGSKIHLKWECPADGRNLKKRPEVQSGEIIVWEGPCRYKAPDGYGRHYGCHSHSQTVQVKSIARRTMLITLTLSGVANQFLLGVDGGTPYVVQVLQRLQTVKEALEWLMPNIVKRAIAQGLDVKRQGDWFFIPTIKEPRRHNCGRHVPRSRPNLKTNMLYRGAALIYNCTQTRHTGGLVIYRSVLGLPCVAPIVRGKVQAPDHEPLYLNQWHIGVRNRSHPWRNAGQQRARFDD